MADSLTEEELRELHGLAVDFHAGQALNLLETFDAVMPKLAKLLASARAVRNVERVERRLRIGLAGGVVMNTELLLSLLRGHAEELRAALTATAEPTAGEER